MSQNKLALSGRATGWRKSHLDEVDYCIAASVSISGRALKLHLMKDGHKSMDLTLVDVKNLYEFLQDHFQSLPPENEPIRQSSFIYQLMTAPYNLIEVSTGQAVTKGILAIVHCEDKNDYFIDENEEGIWLFKEDGNHTLAYRFT